VLVAGVLQRGVHLGDLGGGEQVLAAGEADQDHRGVQGDAFLYRLGHRGGEVRTAGLGVLGDQDDVEAGCGRERVHHLGVLDFFAARQVRRLGPGDGVDDVQGGCGQGEFGVERGQVLADVGVDDAMGGGGFGQPGQDHGLAASVDSAAQQRRDAVGHLIGVRGVAL
jgi:hypothetical protein